MRVIHPGERLSSDCGHHCGIRSAADEGKGTFIGHCSCPECGCPQAAVAFVRATEDGREYRSDRKPA